MIRAHFLQCTVNYSTGNQVNELEKCKTTHYLTEQKSPRAESLSNCPYTASIDSHIHEITLDFKAFLFKF